MNLLEDKTDRELTLSEAAEYLGVSRQAVYAAIANGRISVEQELNRRYRLNKSSLDKYVASKYKHSETMMLNGKPLNETEYVNMSQASVMAKIPRNNLYYAVRNGLLPYELVGRQYIFRKKDIEAYAMKYWGVKDEIRVG